MNKNFWLRLALFALLAAGVAWAVWQREHFSAEALQAWLGQAGWLAPLAFMGLYAAATVLFLPGSVLTLAGGALFGPVSGTFYNLTGATLGALLAFLVARYLGADWVEKKAGGRLKQVMDGVEAEGWRFVAFVRLVPLFPFNLLNYALGLTRVRVTEYLLATYVCMLPGAVAYTYLGYAGREALAGGEGLAQKGLLALGLLAVAAFLPRLARRWRQPAVDAWDIAGLREQLRGDSGLLLLDVRDAKDFAAPGGHIAGARNIPLPELAGRLGELAPHRERVIAVICHTDRRSAAAVRLLLEQGYAQARLVRGGMQAWREHGWPVEP